MKQLKWLVGTALAVSLMVPVVAQAGTPAYSRLTWEDGGSTLSNAIVKNGTVYVQADTLEQAGLHLKWDKSHQRAEFTGNGRSLAVRLGSTSAVLDGGQVRGMPAPFLYQDKLYLSGRFVVMVLEGNSVSWDAKSHVFSAKQLHTYKNDNDVVLGTVSETYAGRTYSVDRSTGELFAGIGKNGAKVKLADLGSPLNDLVSIKFEPTKGGLVYLTIEDVYGEPHINQHLYTLVLKNGAVIRKADAGYWQRFGQNVTSYDQHLLLTDGKTLRIIQDGTGNVEQTLNLVKLGGEEESYSIESIADDYLLIRPNRSGLLTLVDRESRASVKLYEKLLNAEGQEYATTNDVPYHGDELQFVKRDGGTLYFKDNSPLANHDGLLAYKLSDLTKSSLTAE
ncbi:copper amine oxidase N-terminal domain-containing protein [Paenibacillus kobensis]|uniref:copper amine oxidase N-terminal domain-containing protein n=1 Tax=Paenibacillus kobensis TaxID=59841 RepID=UPI0013E3B3B3|nr:copper amine oxidase N-terminal domain-containing protein [Paenibacillus kobensis]